MRQVTALEFADVMLERKERGAAEEESL